MCKFFNTIIKFLKLYSNLLNFYDICYLHHYSPIVEQISKYIILYLQYNIGHFFLNGSFYLILSSINVLNRIL